MAATRTACSFVCLFVCCAGELLHSVRRPSPLLSHLPQPLRRCYRCHSSPRSRPSGTVSCASKLPVADCTSSVDFISADARRSTTTAATATATARRTFIVLAGRPADAHSLVPPDHSFVCRQNASFFFFAAVEASRQFDLYTLMVSIFSSGRRCVTQHCCTCRAFHGVRLSVLQLNFIPCCSRDLLSIIIAAIHDSCSADAPRPNYKIENCEYALSCVYTSDV